jgi:polysaccharide deacetylase 2 family uncharacterized protein YibQ
VTNELERPLGQNKTVRTGAPLLRLPGVTASLAGLAIVGVVAGSTWLSMRDDGLRKPAIEVVAVPVEQPVTVAEQPKAPDQPANGASTVERIPGGPAIITVNPSARDAGGTSGLVVVRDPSAAAYNPRTAHLPDKDMLEESPFGLLPIRSADGRRPVDAYARPWSGARGARVAIVIGGLAVSQTGTQAAIAKLPAEVTLALASGGNSLDRWMREGRRAGHEILMQLPMEPFDYPSVNPGRDTLTVDATWDENRERLLRTLGRTTNYTGILNYTGARFTAEDAALQPVLAELGARGLLYLDDGTSNRSRADALADATRTPFAVGNLVIDGERDRGAILKKLDDLERIARAQGSAIGTGSAFDVTVDTVARWVEEAKRRGIEIVPVSALARDPDRS